MTFPVTQKPTPPTVFNVQASGWVHCEEETGAYYRLSWFTYKLIIIFFNFKVVNFAEKISHFSRNSLKFIIQFFLKEIIGHTINSLNSLLEFSKIYYSVF